MEQKKHRKSGWTWDSVPKGCGIVTIRRKSDGKNYFLGVSDIRQRAADHHRMLNKGTHHNSQLQAAWSAAAPDDFEIVAVEVLPREEFLACIKQLCIDRSAGNTFNIRSSIAACKKKRAKTGATEGNAKHFDEGATERGQTP